jgi:hypothetical protein
MVIIDTPMTEESLKTFTYIYPHLARNVELNPSVLEDSCSQDAV